MAEMARAELARARDRAQEEPATARSTWPVMEKELTALVALAGGRGEEAVARMQEAVVLEGSFRHLSGCRVPSSRPRAERRGPPRAGPAAGSGGGVRAGAEAGDRTGRPPSSGGRVPRRARRSRVRPRVLRTLLANWRGADPELPELKEARAY